MVQRLGRKRLEERVRYAVERLTDDILSSRPVDPRDPSGLRDLVKGVMTRSTRYSFSTYVVDYSVFLPSRAVEKFKIWLSLNYNIVLAEVEFPSKDTLADTAVRAVLPSLGVRASFEKRPLVLHDSVGYHQGFAGLIVGDSLVSDVEFKIGRHGVEVGTRLWVSGLVALGLAEKVKPGVTGEILRWVRDTLRERIRDLVTTELLYSAVREQNRWRARYMLYGYYD
jgi:hypothetical protein